MAKELRGRAERLGAGGRRRGQGDRQAMVERGAQATGAGAQPEISIARPSAPALCDRAPRRASLRRRRLGQEKASRRRSPFRLRRCSPSAVLMAARPRAVACADSAPRRPVHIGRGRVTLLPPATSSRCPWPSPAGIPSTPGRRRPVAQRPTTGQLEQNFDVDHPATATSPLSLLPLALCPSSSRLETSSVQLVCRLPSFGPSPSTAHLPSDRPTACSPSLPSPPCRRLELPSRPT